MRNLLRAEAQKLTSTRSVYWLAAGVAAMSILSVVSISGQSPSEFAKPFGEQQFVFLGTFAKLLLVVIGIRVVTDEWRFGTIVPTFVAHPNRTEVIVAKTAVAAVVGLIVAALGQVALVGSAMVLFSVKGATLHPAGAVAAGVLGAIAAGGLWTALGVGIGAVVRNQVTAIVGTLLWLAVLEEMVRPWLDDLGGYLPGQAGLGLALWTSPTTAVRGGLAFAAWTLVAIGLGAALTLRKDVA